MVKTGLFEAIDSLVPLDKRFATFRVWGILERIFKKRTKRKPKSSNSKHGVERAKSKVRQSKKIQLEGLKLPKPQVVLQKKKTRVKIAKKVEIAFKLYNLRGPKLPTSHKAFFPAPKTQLQLVCRPILPTCKTTQHPSQNHFIHPTNPPSCISAMLAIPHHSQSISMAEIAPKKHKRNRRLGFVLETPHTTSTPCLLSLQRNTEERGDRGDEMKTSAINKSLL
ncbi:hypothetical protein Tco_0472920 [Tanacetum coccineum]